jgi:hypothetical protein
MTFSREDRIDLLLIAIALGSVAALVRLIADVCRPLPFHKRCWVQAKRTVQR